jgi:hypothetical protein
VRFVDGLRDGDEAEDDGGPDDELAVAEWFGTFPTPERRDRNFGGAPVVQFRSHEATPSPNY